MPTTTRSIALAAETLCSMSTLGQDTRFNPARAEELEDDASSGLIRQYTILGRPLTDEDVAWYLTRISELYDKDLVMTMTIHDVVSETPWGPEVSALLDEFGKNSKVKIAKYLS